MGAWWQVVLDELRGFADWKSLVTGAGGWGLRALWDRHRAKRQSAAQIAHEWMRITVCQGCNEQVPRWFMHEHGSARGPVEHYPLPPTCRVCRSHSSRKPPYPEEAQTEGRYDVDTAASWYKYKDEMDRKLAETEAQIEAEERAELERAKGPP